MTTSLFDVERRLRLPAPDEPTRLPALVLPTAAAAAGGVRLRRQAPGVGGGLWSPRLVLAVLALLAAMAAAIATGALRLDRLPNPFDPNAGFVARGITVDYPKDWQVVAAMSPLNDQGGWTALILSNTGVDGCSAEQVGTETHPAAVPSGDVMVLPEEDQTGKIYGTEDRILACVIDRPLAMGEVRLYLTQGAPQKIGIGPFGDFAAEDLFAPEGLAGFGMSMPTAQAGWTQTIDGMPARLVVLDSSVTPGAEEVRTWQVQSPDIGLVWFVQSVMRGPDLDGLRAQTDAVARSLRFDHHLPPLDESTRDVALARAIDDHDRETRRWNGSDLYGCFPRTPGAAEATIDDLLHEYGPGGRLAEPVPVTCTTAVERTPLETWQATLVISWAAGDGYDAGTWGWYLGFDANGNGAGSQGQMFDLQDLGFPGSVGEPPAPLDGPFEIPIGSIVEVLPPGIPQSDGPIRAIFEQPNDTIGDRVVFDAPPGRRYGVIAGPIAHAGYDWYGVESQPGTSYPGEFLWLPSTDGIRPLVRIVEPACPTGTPGVIDLVSMQPLERIACFGNRDLTLDPATARLAEDDGGLGQVQGTPDWLAPYSLWRLYGADGPDGLDGSLPIAIDPALGDAIPQDGWLRVTGHFDDPASATCRLTFPEESRSGETPEVQRHRCRELFVVTSFEERAAP